jgi:hypothetical protein
MSVKLGFVICFPLVERFAALPHRRADTIKKPFAQEIWRSQSGRGKRDHEVMRYNLL